jgi:pSer/pThr/pTyr-binding forkhead associated (FHA) protein
MNYKFSLIDNATGSEQLYWILPAPVVVGRGADAEISIGDASISRRHCQFSNGADGSLIVRDLGSMNGTYVDHTRITKTTLRPGSVVRIGALSLRVEWSEDSSTYRPSTGSEMDVTRTQPMKILPRSNPNQKPY